MDSKTTLKGNITIVLALSFMLILSLLFTILESARLVSVKTHYTDISMLSLDSLFGNYCKDLFDEYGIFAINPHDVNIEDYLTEYANTNATSRPSSILGLMSDSGYNLLTGQLSNLEIVSKTYITDKDGLIFSNQIKEYMKYKELGYLFDSFTNSFNETSENVYDFIDETNNQSLDYSLLDKPYTEDRRECLTMSKEDSKEYSDSLKESVSHALKENLIYLIVEDPSTVSTTRIDKLTLPSVTVALSEEASAINEGYIKEYNYVSLERVYFEEYVSSKFGCYTKPHDNSLLSYELEYIINGQDNDDGNLLSTAVKLISMRASFNIVHILSDNAKRTAVRNLAEITAGAASGIVPFSVQIAEMIIASSWATAEGIIDIRDLLAGKKVPLLKDSSTWTLSLDGITSLSAHTQSSNSGETGFSYEYYLKLLILAQSELALRFRTMDLIQLNICLNYNDTFRLSNCICRIDTIFSYQAKNIFLNLNTLILNEKNTTFTIPMFYTYY